MNEVGYFEIHANNPEEAIKFYTAVFDWEFFKDEMVPIEYWQIKTPGINGGLLKRPVASHSPEQGANAFVCSVQVEDFDKTAEKIMSAGGTVALEKFGIPGRCWQGYFLDTQGNTFGLFQVDPTAK